MKTFEQFQVELNEVSALRSLSRVMRAGPKFKAYIPTNVSTRNLYHGTSSNFANKIRTQGLASATGCLAHTCPMQVDWAKYHGAEDILFTTNVEGGMSSSQSLGKFLHKVVKYDNSFEWYDKREIYQCNQDVWRLLKKDIIT